MCECSGGGSGVCVRETESVCAHTGVCARTGTIVCACELGLPLAQICVRPLAAAPAPLMGGMLRVLAPSCGGAYSLGVHPSLARTRVALPAEPHTQADEAAGCAAGLRLPPSG